MRVVVQLLAHGHAVMLLVSRYVMVPVNYQEHTVVIAAVVPMDRTRGADTPPWWSDCQLTTEDRRCLKIAFVDVPSSVCPSVLLSSSREKDTSDDVILILLQKSAFVGYVRWGIGGTDMGPTFEIR
jgi:hypothetical protein